MGMFYSTRDPLPVFKALQQARGAEGGALRDIRLRIVGQWPAYVEGVIEELDLCGAVELRPYLPHAEALALVASSDVGLIVLADLACVHGTPAKLYEYLGIGLPVLFVGPSSGHAQDLIAEAEGGIAVPYGDVDAIAAAFVQLADLKSAGRLTGAGRPDVVARYERRVQAAALASLLDGLANTTPVSRGGGSEAGHGR
jgi:glycosyltransferase involved in cell wall biosynthesis